MHFRYNITLKTFEIYSFSHICSLKTAEIILILIAYTVMNSWIHHFQWYTLCTQQTLSMASNSIHHTKKWSFIEPKRKRRNRSIVRYISYNELYNNRSLWMSRFIHLVSSHVFALAVENKRACVSIYWGCSSHKLILRHNENAMLHFALTKYCINSRRARTLMMAIVTITINWKSIQSNNHVDHPLWYTKGERTNEKNIA